jgi:hypothetical protein
MNACRLSPRQGRYRTGWNYLLEGGVVTTAMSALGQERTYAVQKGMSALPLKADMCSARAHVCFGPIADITRFIRPRRRRAQSTWQEFPS